MVRALLQRLSLRFSDPALLEQALTHRSAAGEHNERLEFLGDAVIELVVTHWLYRRFPHHSEGQLTRLRARMVCKETLAELAREIDLGAALALGEGERKSGGRHRDSILADGFEALIGALYLDAGLAACEGVLTRLMGERVALLDGNALNKDPKTRLQEWLQSRSLPLPEYSVVAKTGVDHAQHFVVECRVAGADLTEQGQGSSRRRAEQDAARQALRQLGSER